MVLAGRRGKQQTLNGQIYGSFHEAAQQFGLVPNQNQKTEIYP
jgi:hypothetical protein